MFRRLFFSFAVVFSVFSDAAKVAIEVFVHARTVKEVLLESVALDADDV